MARIPSSKEFARPQAQPVSFPPSTDRPSSFPPGPPPRPQGSARFSFLGGGLGVPRRRHSLPPGPAARVVRRARKRAPAPPTEELPDRKRRYKPSPRPPPNPRAAMSIARIAPGVDPSPVPAHTFLPAVVTRLHGNCGADVGVCVGLGRSKPACRHLVNEDADPATPRGE